MRYRHRFRVKASQAAVAKFHARSASMGAITPPPVIVRVHSAPEMLTTGDQMDFTLWVGPLPVHWVVRIEHASDTGFVDRQLQGPFHEWVHRHSYRAVGPGVTEVRDEVNATLRRHLLWGPVGFGMWAGMRPLFAYRAWRTRRILAGNGRA